MNRRLFLGTLFGAAAAQLVPPSQVWPFRKIYTPPVLTEFHRTPYGIGVYYALPPEPNWINLSRSPYPGKLR
jgi:hypothetical protein